jgi:deazaflavin-dependent oxidoreductase (nitroreductase family)
MARRRRLFRAFVKLHVRLYELTGGAVGSRVGRAPVLLLVHRGRTTGTLRTTPLLYLADGESLVVVASYGGAPRDPDWFRNLEANPDAEVQVRRERRPVRARRATAEERERYWPQLDAMYGQYASYRRRTDREIPLVVLEPR